MIKMEYKKISEGYMKCKAEIEGRHGDLVEELSEFIYDLHEKDKMLVVHALDRYLDLVGFNYDGGKNND